MREVVDLIGATQFSHYTRLLNHPDLRQRTDALQDLFFALLRGQALHPDQWETLIPLLVHTLSESDDATLRRWSYQVGSFSYNNNQMLVDYCGEHFGTEPDPENRSWIAAILSKNLTRNEFYKMLSNNDHRLTSENVSLATYLFTDYATFNLDRVLKHGNQLSLMWAASLGAYVNIARHNHREPIIGPHELTVLSGETDDDEVLKHVMYAFYLQDRFNMSQLRFSPFLYSDMGDQQKKWFFTLLWRDEDFLRRNIDYYREILSEQHLYKQIQSEVRIGLARGIAASTYIPELATPIIDWYSHEDKPSALYYLLKYFYKNRELNREYADIVDYQRQHGQESLKGLIKMKEEQEKRYSETDVTGLYAKGILMDVKIGSVGQMNVVESGAEASIVYNPSSNEAQVGHVLTQDEWAEIKRELKSLPNSTDIDGEVVVEAIEAADAKDETLLRKALAKVIDAGTDIVVKVGTGVLVAYMKSIGLLPQ